MKVVSDFNSNLTRIKFTNENSVYLLVIHVFDLIPGASRQNEVTTCHTKTTVHQIAVSRAGTIDDQYLIFVDTNRDIFCTSLKNGSNFEIHKIGEHFETVNEFMNQMREQLKLQTFSRNSSVIGDVGN